MDLSDLIGGWFLLKYLHTRVLKLQYGNGSHTSFGFLGNNFGILGKNFTSHLLLLELSNVINRFGSKPFFSVTKI